MIRLLSILLLACVSAFAQVPQLYSVADQSALAQLTPGGLRSVVLANGFGQFKWDSTSTTATNTNSVFAVSGISTGRWVRVPGMALDSNGAIISDTNFFSANSNLLNRVVHSVPTIYATDPQYGAVGDYTGTQNAAGTGTDNRTKIQAALADAYTPGASFNDLTHSTSKMVKVPNGKYYISAPANGTNALFVPPGVCLDLSEAELHFDRPPLTYNSNTEPNPLFCGILVGPFGHVILGKVIMKPDQDQTYGGTWYGMNIDAIRVQESDNSYIIGGGKDNMIIGWRGAGIRDIGCLNSFVSSIKFYGNCFGIVQSYFGTAFDGSVTGSGYQRFRGNTIPEGVCVALYVNNCSFLNIYKKALLGGVDGDYHNPAGGGFENITLSKIGGGVSVNQTSFENIAEEVVFWEGVDSLDMTSCRIERSGWVGSGSGTILAAEARAVALRGIVWLEQGGTCFKASYTGPLASFTPNPGVFLRVNATDISPLLENVYINNNANSSCILSDGSSATRRPTIINFRTETSTMMQGVNSYMPIPPRNGGGRIESVTTLGLSPLETPNGSITNFSFVNGFTPQIPSRVQIDGAMWPGTNQNGTINWTWGTTNISTTTAPTKDVRAFF